MDCYKALLAPLWESKAHAPTPGARKGHHWSWAELNLHIMEAAKLTSPEVVERRVLRLCNIDPSFEGDESTVGNIAAAIQILLPGEKARPHRHSINALRFVLFGEGATTIVNNVHAPMIPGHMLLTPGDCWHEHYHEGSEPAIWLDILDAPVHNALGTITFQPGPVEPGTIPPGSSKYTFPLKDMVELLTKSPINQFGFQSISYIDPDTQTTCLPTLDIRLLGLKPEHHVIPTKSNADSVFLVIEGEGMTQCSEMNFHWSKNDIFTIPRKNVVTHQVSSDSLLLQVTDAEMLRRIGLSHKEAAL